MPGKKIVRQSTTRRTAEDRLNAALANKPTAASLNARGLTPEQLNSLVSLPPAKQKLIQRREANPVGRRIKNRPSVAAAIAAVQPTPQHKLFPTPDWFSGPSAQADVSVVVPCFKSHEVLPDFIRSWDLADDGLRKEIIFVDDACPFDSKSLVVKEWERRRGELKSSVGKIVSVSQNAGYGPACNIGAGYACGKFIIFLNADTRMTAGWMRPLYDAAQEEGVGVVGNMQLRADGTIDSCGSEWDRRAGAFLHVGRHIYKKKSIHRPFPLVSAPADLLTPRDVEMVTGCCFIIEKDLFTKIGGFDPEYRVGYWEDADLCMKVHANGFRIRFTPESKIYHKVGHTHAGAHPWSAHNRQTFFKRWVEPGILDGLLAGAKTTGQKPDRESCVVYTAITGDYDSLKEQPLTARSVDFVAFSDNQDRQSQTWEVRPAHDEFKDPNRNAKIHKILPHLFFPDKEYSLWIDGSVRIDFPYPMERLVQVYLEDADMALFQHPDRHCIYQEANVCIQRRLDDAEVIRRQIEKYTKDGYPSNAGLAECTVLLRRHSQKMIKFCEAWWDEIKGGSRRDQISFNYVAKKHGIQLRYFSGCLRKKNYLFVRDNHKRQRGR